MREPPDRLPWRILLQNLDDDPVWTANQTLNTLLHRTVLWARDELLALSTVAGKRLASVAFSVEPDTVMCLLCDRKHSMDKCLRVQKLSAKAKSEQLHRKSSFKPKSAPPQGKPRPLLFYYSRKREE